MSLLSLAVKGDLERWQGEEIALTRKASRYAVRVGSKVLQERLAKRTQGVLGPKVAKLWRARVYTNGNRAPAAVVYTKVPGIIASFSADTVILPRKGKYLAIPTLYNRQQGARGGKVKITPKQMVESGLAFTRPTKSGKALMWFLKVPKTGKIAKLNGMTARQAQVKLFGRSGARAFSRVLGNARMFNHTFVPMFILVPSVHLKKRIDLRTEIDRIERELPDLVQEGYAYYDTGVAA